MSIPAWADATDDVVGAFGVAFGPSPAPLAWTCAGPAAEFALRSALCGSLAVVAWPALGVDWAVLADTGHGVVARRSLLDGAVAAANGRRGLRRRAARAARAADAAAPADAALITALREGRLRSTLSERTDGDLLMTVNRLRELLFRVWSHHASAAAATAFGAGAPGASPVRDDAGLAAVFDLPQPLPLWRTGADTASAVVPDKADPRRPHAENVRAAAVEIRTLVDDLARRCADAGVLADPADVDGLLWDELPDVVAGRMSAVDVADRVARRRAASERV